MGHVYDKRENAHPHPVAKNDTLQDLATHYKGQGDDYPSDLTWEELALFNWATKVKREVLRALCERIGTDKPEALKNEVAPETLTLDPTFGPDGTKEILIPKLWKKQGLELKKIHTVKVKKHLPATAVGIKSLDKWFIPDLENCVVEYALEGEQSCADQVDFEVYASKYCKLNAWNDGLPTFTDLPDVPVVKRTDDKATARTAPKIDDWKGLTEKCDDGLLAPGPSKAARALNVAFSPYTVTIRYLKKGTSTARIELAPFWLVFGSDNKATSDSRKIKWTVKGTGRLKFGLLQISDKDGSVVFMKGLAASDLGQDALKEFAWDGKHADGTDASAANMPYRVQIDAHTDIDETDGLAVAAMHTEVRLFVDKETHALDLDPYVAATDKISLDLSLADLYHKDTGPERGDGKIWTKFKLAQAGFHPGPVNDVATDPRIFETALNEFQRSVSKHGGGPGNYQRLTITAGGNDDDDTKNALENLAVNRRRPWFGKLPGIQPKDQVDWTNPNDPACKTVLRDPKGRMIVWVDDRNWYTNCHYWLHPDWTLTGIGVNQPNANAVHNDPADLSNLRGSWEDRDLRVDHDARDIARPWIPLQAAFRLLSRRNNSLDDAVAEETVPVRAEKIRNAIGPLRVDWTFDEIEEIENVATALGNLDLPKLDPEIEALQAGLYHKERNRTRIALRWSMDALKSEHDRVDIHKHCKYYNAPATCGGIRPANAADYYKEPFGIDADSLYPWTAKTSALETVYTVVHDQLGQPDDSFFKKRMGLAGVYFHPSRIAGDGYQVRAQVRFEQAPDYQFPNLEALKARYPKLPQAQSAQFRLWRKSSIRGYVCWGPLNSWTSPPTQVLDANGIAKPNMPLTGPDGFRDYYTACHMRVVNELGEVDGNLDFAPAALFDNTNPYNPLVQNCLPVGDPRRALNATVSQTAWPWSADPHFGVPEPSAPNTTWGDGLGDLNKRFFMPLWLDYSLRFSLEIVKEIEKRKGWMRGHVIVEFQTTPPTHYAQYRCSVCGDTFTFVQNTGAPIRAGGNCPTLGCGGILQARPRFLGHYTCPNCGAYFGPEEETSEAGGALTGRNCFACAAPGAIAPIQEWRERYICNQCGYDAMFLEQAGPPGGSHQNQACPCACGGVLISHGTPPQMGDCVEISDFGIQHSGRCGGVPTPGLPSASCGYPVGVSWNFLRDTDLWGHELGHNRYYEHTGNGGQATDWPRDPGGWAGTGSQMGDPGQEHDSVPNPTVNWAALNENFAYNQTWDRACIMTYASDVGTYDPAKDITCFCFKCVLKNRGWKLHAGVVSPPGNLQDP